MFSHIANYSWICRRRKENFAKLLSFLVTVDLDASTRISRPISSDAAPSTECPPSHKESAEDLAHVLGRIYDAIACHGLSKQDVETPAAAMGRRSCS